MTLLQIEPLDFSQYRNIVILTGAGISAAAGLPTYRGQDGLASGDFERVSNAANLPEMFPELWQLYGGLRQKVLAARFTAAHRAIAHMQKQLANTHTITLITQNVDELHQCAGSTNVIELHGSLMRTRCINTECSMQPFRDTSVPEDVPPCPQCGSPLRPDIVLFNESLPLDASWQAKRALRDCHLFIAIGTSGTVSPAADFVRSAEYAGARTILTNLTPMTPHNPYFKEEYLGDAQELIPQLLGQTKNH